MTLVSLCKRPVSLEIGDLESYAWTEGVMSCPNFNGSE